MRRPKLSCADRARLLIEQRKRSENLQRTRYCCSRLLYGFWVANYVAFNGEAIREVSQDVLGTCGDARATIPLMIGHRLLGTSLLHSGELSQARTHFDQALALL